MRFILKKGLFFRMVNFLDWFIFLNGLIFWIGLFFWISLIFRIGLFFERVFFLWVYFFEQVYFFECQDEKSVELSNLQLDNWNFDVDFFQITPRVSLHNWSFTSMISLHGIPVFLAECSKISTLITWTSTYNRAVLPFESICESWSYYWEFFLLNDILEKIGIVIPKHKLLFWNSLPSNSE